MDNRFSQIDEALREEIKKGRKRTKKIWLFVGLCLLTAIICLTSLLGKSALFFIDGQTIAQAVKEAGANIKTAIIDKPFSQIFSPKEPKNILFLGMPGPGNDAPDLTDTIILAMVQPSQSKITLISIPRDLWVKSPDTNFYTKINSLYASGKNAKNDDYGLSLIQRKAEEITGQKIDYYALVDLSVVKYIIDQQGGVNILVRQDIHDPKFPGPNHSYQSFDLKAGWRYLDGETALKYIRTRHSADGDFDRIERQQQVIDALKQKVFALNPVWDLPMIVKICQELYNKIKTNFPFSEIPAYWQLAKNIPPENVKNIYIEKENNLVTTKPLMLDSGQASIVMPKAGIENYEEIRKFIEENQ